nr:hypothetical protein [Apium graveolens]
MDLYSIHNQRISPPKNRRIPLALFSLRSCVALLARGAAYLKKKGFGIASIFGQGLAFDLLSYAILTNPPYLLKYGPFPFGYPIEQVVVEKALKILVFIRDLVEHFPVDFGPLFSAISVFGKI